jgi:hypothetical protein
MLNDKGQYINLASGSTMVADIAERKYIPEVRTVYLSGKLRRLFEDRTKGVPILESGREKRTPILDLKRLLRFLLSVLGVGLVVTGVVFLFEKRDGE